MSNCSCGYELSGDHPMCLNECGEKRMCAACGRQEKSDLYCRSCLDKGFKCKTCGRDMNVGHFRTKEGYVKSSCTECFVKEKTKDLRGKCLMCKVDEKVLSKCPGCDKLTTCNECVKARNKRQKDSLLKMVYCDDCLRKNYECPNCKAKIEFGHTYNVDRSCWMARVCDKCKSS